MEMAHQHQQLKSTAVEANVNHRLQQQLQQLHLLALSAVHRWPQVVLQATTCRLLLLLQLAEWRQQFHHYLLNRVIPLDQQHKIGVTTTTAVVNVHLLQELLQQLQLGRLPPLAVHHL